MSLILEALKKSEAERQLGQAPGLMTPMPAFGSRRSRAPLWIGAAFAMLGLVAVAGWWFSRSTPAPRPVDGSIVDAGRADASLSGSPQGTQPNEPATAPIVKEESSSDASSPPAATASREAASGLPPALRPGTTDVEIEAPVPRDPEFDSVERESVALTPEALTPAALPPRPPGTVVEPEPAPAPAPTAAPAPPAAAAGIGDPLGVAVADLPTREQLSASERDSLPPLKMSMHLFADDSAARFVLIDGQRYGDGDRIGPSLRVVAIRRDGVELEYNGRHFLLRRP